MKTHGRVLRFHAVADLAAAFVLGVAGLVARNLSNSGMSPFSGDDGYPSGPLVFLLWTLALVALTRGVVLMFGHAQLDTPAE